MKEVSGNLHRNRTTASAMPYYRVYHVSDADRVRSVDDAECRDDREAIAFAKARLKGMPVELWNLARRVALLDADGAERAKPSQRRIEALGVHCRS